MIPNGSITIAAAFVTSDGQKFHELSAAQDHTRTQNLKARYSRLLRDDPEFAMVQLDMFIKLMRAAAVDAATILTEPLEPVSPKTGKPIDGRTPPRPVTVAEELGMPYRPSASKDAFLDGMSDLRRSMARVDATADQPQNNPDAGREKIAGAV